MIPCERYAFFTLVRDASFVTLAGAMMMVGASFDPPLAFKVGASLALIFALASVTDWLDGPRNAPLLVDAKVVADEPSWWLEEAFRGH